MSDQTPSPSSSSSSPAARPGPPGWLRLLVWGAAAGLLALPAVAMRFTDEVRWDTFDFVVVGALLVGAASVFEVAMRASAGLGYRLAAGLAIAAGLLMTWANLAVGLMGPEDGVANTLLLLVPPVAVIGAVLARFRPRGMAATMLAVLATQLVVGGVALAEPPTTKGFGYPWHIIAVTCFFGCIWLLSAGLFRNAAEDGRQG